MKKMYFFFILLILPFFDPILHASEEKDLTFERGFISHPEIPENQIEFFYLIPNGPGPFPVLFLLDGWQPEDNSLGGKQLVINGSLHRLVKEGIAAVSISIPGFGNSDGKRDFGGPYSQHAVIAVIKYFKTLPSIDSSRMGIYGFSRGAALGSMVSALNPEIKCQILEGGFYDLVSPWRLPDYLSEIRTNLFKEAGDSVEALKMRSAVFHMDKIRAATLILHGEFDDRNGLNSAAELNLKLKNNGIASRLKVYLNTPHCLTNEKWDEIIPFLRFYFFNICGIGIKVTGSFPAIQIREIMPEFPASISTLRIGDAILRIAPNNDAEERDVLRMSIHEFVSLILGNPGTKLRLHVQHFDQTYEDVCISRGYPGNAN